MRTLLVNNTGEALAAIDRLMERSVSAVAQTLVIEHKRHLGKPYPAASRPGEFPARRTGNLRSSVSAEQKARHRVFVGYDQKAPYIERLHDKYRRVIDASIKLAWPKLKRAAEGR